MTEPPLVIVRLPGVMTPVPPLKTAVRSVLEPETMVPEAAVKLVIAGAGSTITWAV